MKYLKTFKDLGNSLSELHDLTWLQISSKVKKGQYPKQTGLPLLSSSMNDSL